EQLLGYFRDCMAAAVGCTGQALLHTSPADHRLLSEAARRMGLETILAVMQIIDHTLSRLRYSTQSRTLAEMALVRIANLEDLDELSDVIAAVRSGVGPPDRTTPPTTASRGAAPAEAKKKDELSAPPGRVPAATVAA